MTFDANFVIPAKAGIQGLPLARTVGGKLLRLPPLDPRLRGGDGVGEIP
jgi:hypothetical protein